MHTNVILTNKRRTHAQSNYTNAGSSLGDKRGVWLNVSVVSALGIRAR